MNFGAQSDEHGGTAWHLTEGIASVFMDFVVKYQVPIRIGVIIVIAVILHWVLRRVLKRFIDRAVSGVKKAQNASSTGELALAPRFNARAIQRTRTLGGVGRSIITWVIVLVTLAMVLGQLGFNLTAVLASAGVLAAAIAFGAQNVVKDLFGGIFMVFEDQLGVGDYVKIGDISGTVEDVGVRITQVRAIDGTLWFVRNGEIMSLGNSSQGWGRAVLDMQVDAKKDLETVERTILEAAGELLQQPAFTGRATGQPEIWGVQTITDDKVTLRIAIKTRPEAQWAVQRGLQAILKEKFEAQGTQITTIPPALPGGVL